ncbi:MAG: bifunctional phosphoribosylaminoimidazolecarboxamide formyltransferase/IMP cyclohydrolase [Rhizobiales bacterium]|nr:bifunctional phosphoribosylaminoimidazolecarboxamide formyltransferase/IMP cyclohydrolase [Hyphomicrobiales bacterium]NRB15167.1 bifunctional phosphoribosylaminoimidazolecarboxamide formyltransferase/IMP cyclohydrolase [Hyphomicrobiales bacterium]
MTAKNPPILRALISLSDKTGLIEFAQKLHDLGVELLSTGGTAKAIADAGIPVKDVADITKFPEMMDGRVKTLHPAVHGGLLSLRDNEQHVKAQAEYNIPNIDLLVVNLYPFEATVAKGGDYEDCVENIDIGGPAMIRAAAKNHGFVTVILENKDYDLVLGEMAENAGATKLDTRKKLAAKAYARTAAYDAAIANWFAKTLDLSTPDYRAFGGNLKQSLRYGENPHQTAAFYVNGDNRPGVATAQQLQGKELSFNNINDTDAAFELVAEFDPSHTKAVAIIKHANPCGVATGSDLVAIYKAALKCDPTSAFGGIVAVNDTIDAALATEIVKVFTEVIIAPDVTDEARSIIAAKKNLRLLITGALPDTKAQGLNIRSVSGGMLVQSRDNGCVDDLELKVVTKKAPTEQEMADMKLAFKICKHVKSNAIIYVKNGATVGIGAGQMSRIDSTRVAAQKSIDAAATAGETGKLVEGSVVASDAFFPFADGLLAAAEAGATAIIQPGGSMRDDEVIAAADKAGLAMVFTGMRHFKH